MRACDDGDDDGDDGGASPDELISKALCPRQRRQKIVLMTHKYRVSQQSSREVKPKFIDSTQGDTKNTYKP